MQSKRVAVAFPVLKNRGEFFDGHNNTFRKLRIAAQSLAFEKAGTVIPIRVDRSEDRFFGLRPTDAVTHCVSLHLLTASFCIKKLLNAPLVPIFIIFLYVKNCLTWFLIFLFTRGLPFYSRRFQYSTLAFAATSACRIEPTSELRRALTSTNLPCCASFMASRRLNCRPLRRVTSEPSANNLGQCEGSRACRSKLASWPGGRPNVKPFYMRPSTGQPSGGEV